MVVDQWWDDDVFEAPEPVARRHDRAASTAANTSKGLVNTTAAGSIIPPESSSYNFALPQSQMPSLRLNQSRFRQLQQQVLTAEADMASATEIFCVAAIRVEKCKEMLVLTRVRSLIPCVCSKVHTRNLRLTGNFSAVAGPIFTLKLSSAHAAITLKTCSGKADQAGAGSHNHHITTAAQLPSATLHRNCTRGAICSIGSAAGKISSGPGGSFPTCNQGHATCLMPITRYIG